VGFPESSLRGFAPARVDVDGAGVTCSRHSGDRFSDRRTYGTPRRAPCTRLARTRRGASWCRSTWTSLGRSRPPFDALSDVSRAPLTGLSHPADGLRAAVLRPRTFRFTRAPELRRTSCGFRARDVHRRAPRIVSPYRMSPRAHRRNAFRSGQIVSTPSRPLHLLRSPRPRVDEIQGAEPASPRGPHTFRCAPARIERHVMTDACNPPYFVFSRAPMSRAAPGIAPPACAGA
jgi:hypothetical protein